MIITEETIQVLANMVNIEVTEKEKKQLTEDLKQIVGSMETMNQVDTEGVEPMSHVLPIKNVFREDVVRNGDDREQLLKNAPQKKDGSFVVPKTIE
ncbi:MAG: Asp-tRNA(Asn)/Glu-tRNA(Gln) amidotransferase subunit GatC [Clostridiales bacterium]|nr:Asp-tRNA(Asn)/Glu-tRNA(Gln) amidotransferase subunit GatC [Clostridiales bacterium]